MYIFVDEAGDLSDYTGTGSKYFVLAAVVAGNHDPCNQLTDLRHDLERETYLLPKGFHAKDDPAPRRKRVLHSLKEMEIEIHVVAIKKELVILNRRTPESWVYSYALKHMFGYLSTQVLHNNLRNRLVLPTYSTGKIRRAVAEVSRNIIENVPNIGIELAIWETSSHAGLQIADYCSWAVQRKLERNDDSAIRILKNQIRSSFSPWGVELLLF
jgi:hypothetical protein